MPPISPIKDENTGKTVKSATLTPFRTMSIDEVHRLITSDQRLAELTLAIRNAAAQGDETTARFLKQQTRHSLRRIHPTTKRLPHGILRPGCSRYRPP